MTTTVTTVTGPAAATARADEYATGAYDLPDGADEEPAERGGRRRKERGERTGRLRLGRRDRGEEIWPDDGVSDEDYWASVASDRPLTGGHQPLRGRTAAGGRQPADGPAGQPGRERRPARPAAGSRPGADPRAAGDQRFGDEQRYDDEQRGVTGRLGPPPGLRGDYQPGAGNGASAGSVSSGRAGSGPMAGYAPSGGARPGTGPMAARPGHRTDAAPGPARPGYTPPATGPRPSFQPGSGAAGRRAGQPRRAAARPRADWGERTERIDRVNAAGYPEPRVEQPQPGTRPSGRVGRRTGIRTRSAPGRRRAVRGPAAATDRQFDGHRQFQRRRRAARQPGLANAGPPRPRSWRQPRFRSGQRWLARGRPGRPARRRPDGRPSRRRRPADQHRVLTRVGERLGRPFLPGGRAPFAGPGQADRADADLQRADRLPVGPAADRAVRVRPDRRVPGAAVRHRGADRTRRRARRAVPGRRHRRVPGQPAPRDRCVRGERQVRGRPVPDRRVPGRRLPDQPVPDRGVPDRRVRPVPARPAAARPPATRATPAASRARPGSWARRPARASRSSRLGADSRARAAPARPARPADRALRAGRTDSAGIRPATPAAPACRTRSARPPGSTPRSSPGTGSRARSLSYRSLSYRSPSCPSLRHRSPRHRASPPSRNSRQRAVTA